MTTSREDFQEALDQIDPEFYLDHAGIDYKRTTGSRGPQLNVKECPVCGGDKWKVYLNADSGLGNCFHGDCGKTFNKATFIQAVMGPETAWRDVIEHVKGIARTYGWRPPQRVVYEVNEATECILPDSFPLPTAEGQNLQYLIDRGITNELTTYFHLKYCHNAWHNWTNEAGERKGRNFGGRIIIPVFDLDGDLRTFQGRDITGESDQKYIFPTGLPATSRYLYNGHNARRLFKVCMGEGAFDVFAIKKAFDEDPTLRDVAPIGSFGKHLSTGKAGADQIGELHKLKKGGLRELTIMWDGEAAAVADALIAAEKVVEMLGIKVRIALLPKGKDPNEVPTHVVREAYWKAEQYRPSLAIKWGLRSPYA